MNYDNVINDIQVVSKLIFLEQPISKEDLDKYLISADFSIKQIFIRMVLTCLNVLHILSKGKNSLFDIVCRSDGIIYILEKYFLTIGVKLQIDYSYTYEYDDDTFCILYNVNDNKRFLDKSSYDITNFLNYSMYINRNNTNNGLSKLDSYKSIFLANETYYFIKFSHKN